MSARTLSRNASTRRSLVLDGVPKRRTFTWRLYAVSSDGATF